MNFTIEKFKNIDKKTISNFALTMFRSNNNNFTWSKYSIQSCFLPICKILARVALAVADNSGVLIWMSIANNQNVFLTPLACLVLENCKIPGYIFVLSMRLYRNLHQL